MLPEPRRPTSSAAYQWNSMVCGMVAEEKEGWERRARKAERSVVLPVPLSSVGVRQRCLKDVLILCEGRRGIRKMKCTCSWCPCRCPI